MFILPITGYFIVKSLIKLLLFVIQVKTRISNKVFLSYLQDLGLLVSNLYFRFD